MLDGPLYLSVPQLIIAKSQGWIANNLGAVVSRLRPRAREYPG